MSTISLSQSNWLNHALRGNAIFSGISGLIAILGNQALASLMGIPIPVIFVVLGASLVVYALMLWWLANHVRSTLVWAVIGADLVWVLASAIILLGNPFNLTTAGNWIVLILADIVLVFAIAQFLGLRKAEL